MERNEIEEARNQAVAQANYFIRHTRTSLTATEMDILYYLFSKIKPKDKELMTVSVEIQDFCKVCGIDETSGYNYFSIKNAMLALRNKAAWTEYRNEKGRRGQMIFSWVDTAYIEDGSGEMQVTLSQSIKPFLIGLIEGGNYTQANLISFLALKSKYSKRLYEVLKSYAPRTPFEMTQKEFEIPNLKKLLNAETYPRFANFKQRALDVAVREINNVTDIEVSYTTRKRSGTTNFVTFHFRLKDSIGQGKSRAAADLVLDGEVIEDQGNIIDISENLHPDTLPLPYRQTQVQSGDELFENLWNKVLRKQGKLKARKAFQEALKNGVPCEKISSVLDSYNAYVKAEGIEGRYIKAGGNWFAERYWENEYTISKKKPKNSFHDFNQREYDWAKFEKLQREYQNKKYGFEE